MISFQQRWNKMNLEESKECSEQGKSMPETPMQNLAWLVEEQEGERCSRWLSKYARWTRVASGSWLEMRIQEAHFRSTVPETLGVEPRSVL